MQHNNTSAVGFDFDGVYVLDGEKYKLEAWGKALAPYTGQYETLLKEGNSLYGFGKPGGRREILRHVFIGLGISQDKVEGLVDYAARVFDDYVQSMILRAGLAPGALEMLQELSELDIPLYLNSGTATSALVKSAKNLKIDRFFRGILGSTKEPVGGGKVENLSYIAKREGVQPSSMLFVGDGDSDSKAARVFGCRFLGVANRHNGWADMPQEFDVITDLQSVLEFV